MNKPTAATTKNHALSSNGGPGCVPNAHVNPMTRYTTPPTMPVRLRRTNLSLRRGSRRRAGVRRWARRRRFVRRLPGMRVRAAGVGWFIDPFQEELVEPAGGNRAAVVSANHPRHDPRWLRPERRPRMARVMLVDERLPHGGADVLTEHDVG